MKKNLLLIALFCCLAIISCKKVSQQDSPKPTQPITALSTLTSTVVPTGFKWENSRNINFTIGITDTRFQSSLYIIAIYDGDPVSTGNLLSKGSASTSSAFVSKLFISKQITQVFLVKYAPDGSNITKIVPVDNADIAMAIGAN